MKNVTIYTGDLCGYCLMAKELLDSKNILYEEINIDVEKRNKNEMIKLSGGKTSVPQIFFGKLHIGGFDELYKLVKKKKLDRMLNREISA